jgi:nucleoside-diphosphate-sugar epimerase
MRYFVTGATGFIGGRLVRQLLAAGHEVAPLVRDPARARDLASRGVTLHAGDITVKESLRGPMHGADGVFHLAAWYEIGTKERSRAEFINVQGTRNVLETMRDLGIPRGVYTSTVAVFSDTKGKLPDESYRRGGPWITLYDYTKWKAHYEVAEPMIRAGLPLVIVQPGIVYGPGDHSIVHRVLRQFLHGELRVAPRGAAYCWSHVDDVARGHVLAMDKGRTSESYILAGPMHTTTEVFELASRVSGLPMPKWQPSPLTMKLLAEVMHAVGALVPLPDNYRYESLRVMAGVTYGGSSAKAERELGWSCRPLEEGLRETILDCMRELNLRPPGPAPSVG